MHISECWLCGCCLHPTVLVAWLVDLVEMNYLTIEVFALILLIESTHLITCTCGSIWLNILWVRQLQNERSKGVTIKKTRISCQNFFKEGTN